MSNMETLINVYSDLFIEEKGDSFFLTSKQFLIGLESLGLLSKLETKTGHELDFMLNFKAIRDICQDRVKATVALQYLVKKAYYRRIDMDAKLTIVKKRVKNTRYSYKDYKY